MSFEFTNAARDAGGCFKSTTKSILRIDTRFRSFAAKLCKSVSWALVCNEESPLVLVIISPVKPLLMSLALPHMSISWIACRSSLERRTWGLKADFTRLLSIAGKVIGMLLFFFYLFAISRGCEGWQRPWSWLHASSYIRIQSRSSQMWLNVKDFAEKSLLWHSLFFK